MFDKTLKKSSVLTTLYRKMSIFSWFLPNLGGGKLGGQDFFYREAISPLSPHVATPLVMGHYLQEMIYEKAVYAWCTKGYYYPGCSEGLWRPGQETKWCPVFFCLHMFAKRLTPWKIARRKVTPVIYVFILSNLFVLGMPNGWSYIFYTWHYFAPPGSGAWGKSP